MERHPIISTFSTARLVIVLSLLLSSGCAAVTGSSEPLADRSRDPIILQEIQARLAAETSLDASQIRVEVTAGRVTLYGSVEGVAAWQCAVSNAQLVTGVKSVVDFLVIERGPARIICGLPRASG
jgi:osmotically-inducible protein OsmY